MYRLMRLFLQGTAALLLPLALPAGAQTLDQQYEFYLARNCFNMGFARNGVDVAPGQAGPNLQLFCRIPEVSQDAGTVTPQGGAGWPAANSTERGDTAARRRKQAQRNGGDASQGGDRDIELASFSNLSLFLLLDYQYENQQTTSYEAGRVTRSLGGSLGLDHRFGSRGVAGIVANYGHITGDIDTGGDFDGNTWGALLFGSWWPLQGAFIDVTLGFNQSRLDLQRIVFRQYLLQPLNPNLPPRLILAPGPAPAFSDPRSSSADGELRAGYDFAFGGFTVGPRVGATLKHAQLDRYTETGATPMTLTFAERKITALQSVAGIQASLAVPTASVVLVPQLNADWVHEYQNDQKLLRATFAEDLRPNPSQLRFLNNAPDRDWFLLRASLAVVFVRGFSGFVSVEANAGHSFIDRYRASLGLRKEL